MTGYTGMIMDATGASYTDALEIEELMRLATDGTLDSLERWRFNALAREAEAALVILREGE